MNEDNPFKAGPLRASPGSSESVEPPPVSEGQAAYNTMTDLVGGLNVRKSDNVFQAKFILASVILAALVGAAVVHLSDTGDMPVYGGALLGSFAGLVIGFFASGIVLMVYRGIRHLRGKHD